jgi:uncharacterized OB-fold protein
MGAGASAVASARTIEGRRRACEEERHLTGLRCEACGFVTAGWMLACPRCGRRGLAEVALSGRGRVVAGTVQTVPSEEFVNDAPYAYIIVELEEGGRITGWMPSVRAADELRIGDRVRWTPSYRAGVVFEKDPAPAAEK